MNIYMSKGLHWFQHTPLCCQPLTSFLAMPHCEMVDCAECRKGCSVGETPQANKTCKDMRRTASSRDGSRKSASSRNGSGEASSMSQGML